MKHKPIILFILLTTIIASFNFISCHKNELKSDDYSDWGEVTAVDSVIYAKARTAYLDNPTNEGTVDYVIIQFLSQNPYAVRTKTIENGNNYQFACRDCYIVTVYKGIGDKVGKVIEITEGFDSFPGPIPPDPRKRDTLIY